MAGLNATDAMIFRITHRDNIPWILEHGIHCQASETSDPNFVPIGMQSLIEHRQHRVVEIGPGGHLRDYVPFYFTPYSIMMYKIKTGHGEAIKRPNEEIVILVSSIPKLVALNVPFIFTNGHACLAESDCYDKVDDLSQIDWKLLQSKDFRKDPNDPGKQGRYQAEALVHRHVPLEAILGIVCYDAATQQIIQTQVTDGAINIEVKAWRTWYF